MSFADLGMAFDAYGIGTVLLRNKLRVPENQRAYAWLDEHIQQLFEDLSAAFRTPKAPYFLGTIVLTGKGVDRFDVTDGQQRLATTSILIAAIRDFLEPRGEQGRKTAAKYTSDYLLQYDEFSNQDVPKFILGVDDNEFFREHILCHNTKSARAKKSVALRKSHERLSDAQIIANKFIKQIVSTLSDKDGTNLLLEWIDFLQKRVIVIVITAAEDVDAYKMFETLNDRGLKASQIDILKNFLFKEGKKRIHDLQPKWSSMVGKVEEYDEDLLLDYVRHFWIAKKGPTKAPELAGQFKKHIVGDQQAMEWVSDLDKTASDYISLLQPLDHPRLTAFGSDTRAVIYTITKLLGIEQIRPLMLAVLQHFGPEEAKLAFVKFVSWSVRFLVVGGGSGGLLDRHYGLRAQEVTDHLVTTAKELTIRMNGVVPNNAAFEAAFARHAVTKAVLARYYLRCLDKYSNGDDKSYIGEFERAQSSANLEHIMPETAWQTWGLQLEVVEANYKRIGNLCLLEPKKNVLVGNETFDVKVKTYKSSTFTTTQDVARYSTSKWGIEEIDLRQADLAKSAPKIWVR